jgi:hypothetical protein
MSESMSLQSWSELYQLLRGKAESCRGTVTVAAIGAPRTGWPHTTVRDVFAIALVFDTAIEKHAPRAVVARWFAESNLLAGEPEDSVESYFGNRSFWATLAEVTVELDRVAAPLPPLSVIDHALRELEVPRPAAASDLRNAAAGTMLATVFAEPSWRAMALRQAEFFRRLRGDEAGDHRFARTVPATCNADVLSLADYWSDQLGRVGDSASDTLQRLLFSCWREVLHCVRRDARHAPPHERCAHNSDFWTSLLALTTRSDVCTATPTPWAFQVPESPRDRRNALPDPLQTGEVVQFAAAKADDAARQHRDTLGKLRGEDAIAGRLISRVPRTTVADVRQLAEFWSHVLAGVGEHHFADVSYRPVIERWRAAVAEVARIPDGTDAASVYAHNADFWEALITLSVQIATTSEAPSRFELFTSATAEAVKDLPGRLKSAAEGLVRDAIARPLTSIGIGLGSLALLYLLLRSPGCETHK